MNFLWIPFESYELRYFGGGLEVGGEGETLRGCKDGVTSSSQYLCKNEPTQNVGEQSVGG